jgi:tetratricopeptide (TPR) repeat protein
VALKVVKPGMDTRQVIARFEAERQALALMDHPNIARVLDAGTTEAGRPYFVMDLVRGVPITRYCDEHHLTPRQRLELFIPVCQAIQHAHQKGIIHRDLKPSNVLVALYDGKPVPKVIDFGVAKATGQTLTDKTLVTGFGAIVGTLEYMSPEQAEVNQLDIDTRSDIYSLGVLLYELLTGSPPFSRKDLEKAGMLEMLRVIREEEPSKPSTKLSTAEGLPTLAANRGTEPAKLTKLVRGELDWIVMKALEKDRSRRYETANGFAMDVQRYLADEPVLACPPSLGYRLRKFARRNKRILASAAVVALALLVALGALAGSVGWIVRDRAYQRETKTRVADSALRQAAEFLEGGELSEAAAWVRRVEVIIAGEELPPDLRQRLDLVRADLGMVTGLEEALLGMSDVRDEHFDHARSDALYAKAFLDYGIDPDKLQPEDAAERIRARPIRTPLATALDRWARVRRLTRGANDNSWKCLLAVSRLADPDPWRNQLRDALETGDRLALEKLAGEENVADHPAISLVLLARALSGSGGQRESLALLHKAREAYPGDFWINHDLGYYSFDRLKSPQWANAARFLTAAQAIRPQSPGANVNLGFVLRRHGDLEGAMAAYRRAIQLKPDYATPYNNLGLCYSSIGQWEDAVISYRQALRFGLHHPQTHFGLSQALVNQGDRAAAITAAQQGLLLKPAGEQDAVSCANLAWLLTGTVQANHAESEVAVQLAKRAVAQQPKAGLHWTRLGISHYRAGEWKSAISALEKAIEIYGVDATQEWFFVAMAHWQQGDKVAARLAFVQAVRSVEKAQEQKWLKQNQAFAENLRLFRAETETLFGPDEAKAALERPKAVVDEAQRYVRAKRWAEAVPLYKEAQQWHPYDDAIWFEYALVLLLSNGTDSFRQYRAEVLERPGLRDHFKVRLPGLAPVELAEAEKAVDLAEKTLAVTDSMLNANNAGLACFRAGRFDAAVKHFHHSLELAKGSPRVMNWAGLALAYHHLGEAEDAKQWFGKASDFARDNPDGTVMHLHHWLSFHVLLREAEELIGENSQQESQ